ncbi:MAG: transcriptional regulator [Planctomycetaceae bacterium]
MASPDEPMVKGDELPTELIELGRLISQLPGPQFKAIEAQYAQVTECFRRRRRILNLVQEALSQLRLDIKYLMFDLDVTRKERDEYRAALDQHASDDFDVT